MVSTRKKQKKGKKKNRRFSFETKGNFHSQVLQRKTEEAAVATKRLKELLEARKSSPREHSGIISNVLWFHSWCSVVWTMGIYIYIFCDIEILSERLFMQVVQMALEQMVRYGLTVYGLSFIFSLSCVVCIIVIIEKANSIHTL